MNGASGAWKPRPRVIFTLKANLSDFICRLAPKPPRCWIVGRPWGTASLPRISGSQPHFSSTPYPQTSFFKLSTLNQRFPGPCNLFVWKYDNLKINSNGEKIWKFLTSIWFHSVDLLCFICDIQDPLILDFFWVINLLFLFRFPLIYCFNLLQTEFLAPIYQTPLMAFKREFCTSLPLHQIISNYFWRQVNWWRQFIVYGGSWINWRLQIVRFVALHNVCNLIMTFLPMTFSAQNITFGRKWSKAF